MGEALKGVPNSVVINRPFTFRHQHSTRRYRVSVAPRIHTSPLEISLGF